MFGNRLSSDEPLLTIATVTRNCATSIEATLHSVAEVKSLDVEYVVVDGASTDGTLEELRRSGNLIDQMISEPDSGIYNAMNKAAALARGKYVLFINGDDVILPEGFTSVMRTLECCSAGIVCGWTLVGSVHKPAEVLVAKPWKLPFFNSIPHPSTFTSRALLRRYPFREDLRIASDYDFFLRCLLAGVRFISVGEPTALHIRGGASADIELSRDEVSRIRRERLGLCYPPAQAAIALYRLVRRSATRDL